MFQLELKIWVDELIELELYTSFQLHKKLEMLLRNIKKN